MTTSSVAGRKSLGRHSERLSPSTSSAPRASAHHFALFWSEYCFQLILTPSLLPCSRSGGLTIREVVGSYDQWESARKRRVRQARTRAVEALSGRDGSGVASGAEERASNSSRDLAQAKGEASLARFKKGLARVRAGKLDTAAFVDLALSPAFFGSDGWGALSGSAQHAATESSGDAEIAARDELAGEQATEKMADSAPLSVPADGEAELLSPLVALLRTLPDERAALRDELVSILQERGLRI